MYNPVAPTLSTEIAQGCRSRREYEVRICISSRAFVHWFGRITRPDQPTKSTEFGDMPEWAVSHSLQDRMVEPRRQTESSVGRAARKSQNVPVREIPNAL